MPTETIDIGDGKLNVDVAGTGAPVVLLHGFALDMRMWDPQFDAFAERHRTIRYDLRGFGKSSRPTGSYSHADDLTALLDRLDIDKAIFVGLSLGSNIALDLVSRHPDRVAGLVLASPSLPGYPWRWTGDRPREQAGALAKENGLDTAKAYWSGHDLFASARESQKVNRELSAMTSDYDGWHWLNTDPQWAMPPMQPTLARITVPTFVMSGHRDIEAYREIADIIDAEVPGARFMRLPLAGHMLNLESPQAFNDAVLAFCAQIGGRP